VGITKFAFQAQYGGESCSTAATFSLELSKPHRRVEIRVSASCQVSRAVMSGPRCWAWWHGEDHGNRRRFAAAVLYCVAFLRLDRSNRPKTFNLECDQSESCVCSAALC
jgi:hypothetical protein